MGASRSELRVADIVARGLYSAGVRHAFGIPGGEVLTFVDALRAAGIEFVLGRHESACGMMAEGAYHATGAPGVLVATLGPGVMNTPNVVANALQDRVPLLVFSGVVSRALAGRFTHQIVDTRAVLRPLVKADFTLTPADAAHQITEAIRVAQSGRPGPVHLALGTDVADTLVPVPAREDDEAVPRPSPLEVPLTALAALARAERPLILAGLDLLEHEHELREFVARSGFPVLSTYKAKGVLGEDDPRAIAAFGLSPRVDEVLLPFVREADLVLALGYDPVEVRSSWVAPFSDDTFVIETSVEPSDEAHGVFAADAIVRGPATELFAVLERVELGRPSGAWITRAAEVRAAAAARFAPAPDEPWSPRVALAALAESIAPDVTVTVDTGAHRILLSQQWRMQRARQLLQSSGFCTMAYALPTAAGYLRARPDARVVAVLGDGGLEMGLGELGTLRDEGLPLVVVVLDDRSLALIEKKQRSRELPNVGVDFGPAPREDFRGTDYVAIAEAFGGVATRVSDPMTLRDAMRAALARREAFSLIHLVLPRRGYDARI